MQLHAAPAAADGEPGHHAEERHRADADLRPARASLLSGPVRPQPRRRRPSTARAAASSRFDEHRTLPVWLQHAGYRTMFIGKYLNGYGEQDAPTHVPAGVERLARHGRPLDVQLREADREQQRQLRHVPPYCSDRSSATSPTGCSGHGPSQKPWYMWVNYVAPAHRRSDAPDDPASMYPDDQHPLTTTTPAPRDAGTFSRLGADPEAGHVREGHLRQGDHPRHAPTVAGRTAATSSARSPRPAGRVAAVGRPGRWRGPFRTLKRHHQLRKTYVVFTSDNGYVLGEHNLTGKLWYFRDISRDPDVHPRPRAPPGSVEPDTGHQRRLGADVRVPRRGDADPHGRRPRCDAVAHLGRRGRGRCRSRATRSQGGRTPLYTGIIDGPWTWVQGRAGRGELYRRTVDPCQNHNLAKDPRYQEQKRKLAR